VQDHDIDIYLTVLLVFIAMLFVGLLRVGSRWTTWYQNISLLKDIELREWYLAHSQKSSKELETLTDPAVLKLAHTALHHEVLVETKKHFFSKKSTDPLVVRLSSSFEATDFLMVYIYHNSEIPANMFRIGTSATQV